jgi:hypothetical protein
LSARDSLIALVVASLLLTSAAGWAAPSRDEGAGNDDFEVVLIDGEVITGRLSQPAPRLSIETASGARSVEWADVLTITPPTPTTAPAAAASQGPFRFELSDGSRFLGSVVGASEQDFIVEFGADRTCRLGLAAIVSIVAREPSAAAGRVLADIAADAQRTTDQAVVSKGEEAAVMRGAVRRITAEHVAFEFNSRALAVPWSRLAGLYFAPPAPRGASCRVRMIGGDVFAGRVRSGSESSITLQSSFFDNLELPWSGIARIECRSERMIYLSELAPAAYEFEPFFEKRWPYAVDATLTGRPIVLRGRTFPRGVCMHSRSKLTYRIGGAFDQLVFVAGIVDEMENRGDVTLRVIGGDGGVLWQRDNVRGGQPPIAATVDVRGAQDVTLEVDYGEGLDLSDQAVWAAARLIRR